MRETSAGVLPRDATSRARFFLARAGQCTIAECDECEAYLEAAIVFARAALHRLQTQFGKHHLWKSWWDSLLLNTSVRFFRDERNWILKTGPPKIGQVIRPGPPSNSAADMYYYESPEIPATQTVMRHLHEIERLIADSQERFT